MRWDNLLSSVEEARTLPGYRAPARVRTFDAPEALDVRFYEVHAKSALNRVPERSQMPFRWTINPYRGCTHACRYCTSPETPVLMADGRVQQIADLSVGDAVYGTVMDGAYRRYVPTRVLDKWETRREAYRVVLEDGTELITSGDHRFLARRGWQYVAGAEQGRRRRPHLTLDDQLLGTGRFASAPLETSDYRRGYLCGLVRGEGHLALDGYPHPGRHAQGRSTFRPALVDLEALMRAREYLARAGIETVEFAFQAATETTRGLRAIRAPSRERVERIRELIRWPWSPSLDWSKGFLAGMFDADGSWRAQALRISNTDRGSIEQAASAMRALGFRYVVEDPSRANGIGVVRLRGGLREKLRFFHTVEPAISRKRSIDGIALKSDARTKVVAVETLGKRMRMYDITTGTGDFIANGVVSHNCFARPTHTYLDFNAGADFEREIVVKVNLPEVLRAELARPSWKREHVALGTNTDPYQWVEGRYRLMPEVWDALLRSDTPCSVLTKSPLLLRDLGLFRRLRERVEFTANLSIPTLDEKAWRASEPHTPHPRKRIEAVAELHRAGIPTGVLIAPLMPGINDDPRQVEDILVRLGEAGVDHVAGIALHLRGEVRGVFMDWLRSYRPDLVERYERLYARSAYAPREEQERLQALARGRRGRRIEGAGGRPRPAGRPEPEREGSVQQSLF